MAARDPGKPDGYYCDGKRHKPDCADKTACDGCAPPCSSRAGAGTSHVGTGRCSRHLGSTRNHVRAAEVEMARQAVTKYGLAVDVDPAEAMMQAVATSYGQVLYLRAAVARLKSPWTEDGPHVAWTMLKTEEKLHTDICRDALRAGVERRHIEMQEEMARKLVEGFAAFARLLGHDPSSQPVREAGRAAFSLIAGGKSDAAIDGTAREVG